MTPSSGLIAKVLCRLFSEQSSEHWIHNLKTQVDCYHIDEHCVPASINDEVHDNCYIASPYQLLIAFAKDELVKLESFWLRALARMLISSFSAILHICRIDKIQTLNNYFLSTNVFPEHFKQAPFLAKLMSEALARYPQHSLALRCVNLEHDKPLADWLDQQGFIRLVTRQVYWFEDFDAAAKHQNYQRDVKLLYDSRFQFIAPDPDDYSAFEQVERLYNQLYLEKYSVHNVQFSAAYLQQLYQQGVLHLRALYDENNKKMVAAVGLIGENQLITTPIVGYDMSYPRENALYRRVIIYALEYARAKGYVMNLSSGASGFKRLRGGRPDLEYMYVYCRHLPWHRRALWKVLAFISTQFYARLLRKYQL